MNNPNIGQHPRLMGATALQKKQEAEKFFCENLNETLKYTQKMRDIIIRSQAHFYIEGDPIKTNLVAQNLEKRANELEKCYNDIEKLAKELPNISSNSVPNFELMGKYLDEANVDIFTMANADRARDESITSIYTEQFSSIMGDYLAPMQVIRNRSKWYPAEISEFNTRIKSKNDFYAALKEAISIDNDRAAKSGIKTPRIVEKRLEESFNRLIIEIHMVTPPSKDPFKMLFLVNNNEISMVNLYAFAEDYTYIDAARTKIDVFAPSKCELHKALSQTLNSNYQAYVNTAAATNLHKQHPSPTATKILYCFSLVTRLSMVFTTPCKICGKFLKHGMPPIIFELRARTVVHEDCR